MNKKVTLISIIISIIILLILVGVYLVNKLSYKTTSVIEEDVSIASDWKIYKDTKYGFEIKYPSNWNISENILGNIETDREFCPPELSTSNGMCKTKDTYGHMPDTYAPILFFQRPGDEVNSSNPKYRVLGSKNGFKYELVITNSDYYKEYELMASSFRFITATTSKVVTTNKSATTSKVATIKVIYPNGGENWSVGEKHKIKFEVNGNVNPNHVVALRMVPGEIPITYLPTASSSYEWIVPNVVSYGDSISKLTPGLYKIKVSIYEKIPCIGICAPGIGNSEALLSDESDNYFTINPTRQFEDVKRDITVLSPNGEEEWVDKSVHQIIWSNNSTTTNLVDLYLWDDLKCGPYGGNLPVYPTCPQAYITLDKNINTNSIYNWIVGTDIKNNNIVPGRYKVAVCKAGNFDCDFSDTEFSITSK